MTLRPGPCPQPESQPRILEFQDLRLDIAAWEAERAGQVIKLTRTEYQLLEMFLRHPQQVLTRQQILSEVWGFDFETDSSTLEVYVGYLRRKTEQANPVRIIHNIRGVGHVLKST